ncbi:MAG: biotin--[acetyl-CoA-carboxylase] ligase [Chitinophagales bacterium]|nr:biotin--[acetyl-CoA-carboxylase] ligase [Chitinophagales bacterium]
MEILLNNTIFTGKFLIHLPRIDSTNKYAADWLSKNAPTDGTVIIADEQYAGKGQIGNFWVSEPFKNLTFSLIFTPTFLAISDQFYLNMAVSLGILQGLSPFLPNNESLTTKWPNDIYYINKKLGGVLIENTLVGTQIKHSIVGIGLNICQTDFPESLPNACSLQTIANHEFNRTKVLESVCVGIEYYYLLLRNGRKHDLHDIYEKKMLHILQERAFKDASGIFTGTITGVEKSGKLILKTKNEQRTYSFKEIEWMW